MSLRWRWIVLCGGLVAAPLRGPVHAQIAEGDSAWAAGRYEEAREAYLRALRTDSTAVRPLYRLGVLASWNGDLDSALALIRRARAADPRDPDLRAGEARVLSWQGRLDRSLALYDSVLRDEPGHRDAALGRAQVLAWSDRLRESEAAYRAFLRVAPDDADAGLGLARVLYWMGESGEAREELERVLAASPDHRDALALRDELRAAAGTRTEASAGFSDDTDDNTAYWQTLAAYFPVAGRLSGLAGVGLAQLEDPVREGTRAYGEAGLAFSGRRFTLTGAAGARRLSPDAGGDRTEPTVRAGLGVRPGRGVSLAASYAHLPVDETAFLLERDLDADVLDAGLDALLTPDLTLSLGGGAAWFSDGNRRASAVGALTQTVARHFFVGALGRVFGYEERGVGYFSPDRFTLAELRAGYSLVTADWTVRVSGGGGLQWIGRGASSQEEWHAEARLARRWRRVHQVELFGGISNSAASSTTGAFRYGTAGVAVRIGL